MSEMIWRGKILQAEPASTHGESEHLSDEQFAGLFLGTIPGGVQTHLDTCAQCAEEVERAGAAFGSFERDSRLWAERRAATTAVSYPARPMPSWLQLPAAWAVAAVAMVIATTAGLPHSGDRSASVVAGQVSSSSLDAGSTSPAATEVPASTLNADNELLSAINGKLRANDTPSAEFYGLQAESNFAQSAAGHGASD